MMQKYREHFKFFISISRTYSLQFNQINRLIFKKNFSMEVDKVEFAVDKTAYTVVKEGKAEILFPNTHDVFYNPVQEFNRDLSVAVISQYAAEKLAAASKAKDEAEKANETPALQLEAGKSYDNGLTVLEALSASGLRAIRYALEIPGLKNVLANDVQAQAIESIERNIAFNKVSHLVTPNREDASLVMYRHRKRNQRFDVVDLDPYGSPVPFLDGAIQCIKDGGLLLVTCTDVAILCGNSSEKCYALYGSMSLKTRCCHEMALRVVLRCIESHANRYGRYIVPLLSVSVDFYLRIFVKVFTSQSRVKQSASKSAYVYQCLGCETLTLQPVGKCSPGNNGKNLKFSPGHGPTIPQNCVHCGHKHEMGGPIWAKSIYDKEFTTKLLKSIEDKSDTLQTSKRMIGILNVILEELEDYPLFYVLDKLCGVLHCICPSMMLFRSAVLNAGFRISMSHTYRTSIKTDAPPEVLWDILRSWIKLNPLNRPSLPNSPAQVILEKESSINVSFEIHEDANPVSKQKKLLRYQLNPEKYWGPKMRSTTSLKQEAMNEKSVRLQGKRQRNSPQKDLKLYQCKRFKQGKCDLGDKCRYSHGITDSQTKEEKNV